MSFDRLDLYRDSWPETGPDERTRMLAHRTTGPKVRRAGLTIDDPYEDWVLAQILEEKVVEDLLEAGPEIHLRLDEDDTDYDSEEGQPLKGRRPAPDPSAPDTSVSDERFPLPPDGPATAQGEGPEFDHGLAFPDIWDILTAPQRRAFLNDARYGPVVRLQGLAQDDPYFVYPLRRKKE